MLITFDGLPARALACYGNAAASTACFNRLAARGMLFERHFDEDPLAASHDRFGLSWSSGCFQHVPRPSTCRPRMQDALAELGVELEVWFTPWTQPVGVDLQPDRNCPDMAAAGQAIKASLEGGMPLRGLQWWSLPGLRQSTADGQTVDRALTELDEWLGGVLEAWERCADETCLVVTATAGLESADGNLTDACAQTPLFLAGPGWEPGQRSQLLTRSVDILPSVIDLLGGCLTDVDGNSLVTECRGVAVPNVAACWGGDGQRAWRTDDFLLLTSESADGAVQLFAKPEDRWDLLDVAEQFPDEVVRLSAAADRFVSLAGEEVPVDIESPAPAPGEPGTAS